VKSETLLVPVAPLAPIAAFCVILPPVIVFIVMYEPVVSAPVVMILAPELTGPEGLAVVPDSRKKVLVVPTLAAVKVKVLLTEVRATLLAVAVAGLLRIAALVSVKVAALAVFVAALLRVIAVLEGMALMVVPEGIPGPVTGAPTASPVVLVTLTVALPLVVPPVNKVVGTTELMVVPTGIPAPATTVPTISPVMLLTLSAVERLTVLPVKAKLLALLLTNDDPPVDSAKLLATIWNGELMAPKLPLPAFKLTVEPVTCAPCVPEILPVPVAVSVTVPVAPLAVMGAFTRM